MNKEQIIKNIASLADKWKGLTIEKQEDKVFEEYNELLEAKKSGDIEEIKKELADVIITMIVLDNLRIFMINEWVSVVNNINLKEYVKPFSFENSTSYYILSKLKQTATQYNINVWECLEYKYNIVAKREGEVINGAFIKK